MKKYKWYINRIKRMGLSEIAYRMNWKFRQDFYYRFLAGKPKIKFLKKGISSKNAFKKFNESCNFWFQSEGISDINSVYLSELPKNKLLKEANKILKREFKVYDFVIKFKNDIDWNTDSKTKKRWPSIYQGNIYFNSSEYGSVLYVWVYNRFDFLYKLGAAYLITKDEKYAKEICYCIESWIDQNPYLIGINWFSPLEMSIRITAWIWAINMIRDSQCLDKKLFSKIMHSIYLQMDYVYHNLSRYSSANNHLIGEVSGLVFAGSLLPFLRDADKFKKRGLKILKEEIPKQILEDGVSAEQTPSYLAFVIDFCIMSYLIAKNDMPSIVKERLVKAAFFLSELINNKNQIHLMGDSGEGKVIGFNTFEENFSSLIGLLMIMFNEEKLKSKSAFDDKVFWIYGPGARKKYNSCKAGKEDYKSSIYEVGGYAFLRNPKNKSEMVFDFGPMGYLSIAAHGHADILSITFSAGGVDFLVDPGTYLAHSGGKWRDYFKSTHAHNTIVVDDNNQAKSLGVSIWDSNPRGELIKAELYKKKETVRAKHEAFKKVGVTHIREIINDKVNNKFVIKDFLNSDKKHIYTAFFHLHPDITIKKHSGNSFELLREGKIINIKFSEDADVSVVKGKENPILGWYSPKFGFKEKTNVICARFANNINITEISIKK